MQYRNPILRGFHPDPSVCRVGEDYYLVTSSFEYFPAMPVYHSRDLVNWTLLGNAQTFSNSLDLRAVRENGGIWAPTIRYHEGLFYIVVVVESSANVFANYILHAKDPAGPWSDPVRVEIGGIDPSILFDGGKAYFCTNDGLGLGGEGICLGVIDPLTGRTLEPFRRIWAGTGEGWLEAPHVYHIGEWYYLLCAEGGTYSGHMEVAARARSVWGPYESCPDNPILTNRNDTTKQACCCGHADLFEDHLGNWWMVHLGVRPGVLSQSQMARETFLTPVTWKNGWPSVQGRRARIVEEGPIFAEQKPWPDFVDDFTQKTWPSDWIFVRNPDEKRYVRENGTLSVLAAGSKPDAKRFEGLACVRQPDMDFCMEADLCVDALACGVSAGLCVMVNHMMYMFWGVKRDEDGLELFLERRADDLDVITYTEKLDPQCTEDGWLRLTIRGTKECYAFGVTDGEGSVYGKCTASARFFANVFTGRGFTGTMTGLYAEAEGESEKMAVFRHFALSNPERLNHGEEIG